jgi:hypothetical protein
MYVCVLLVSSKSVETDNEHITDPGRCTSGLTDAFIISNGPCRPLCYCQPCWLFSKQQNALSVGFNHWIHLK